MRYTTRGTPGVQKSKELIIQLEHISPNLDRIR